MDKRIRNLTIVLACSVIALAMLFVYYANRPETKKGGKSVSQGQASSGEGDPYRAFLKDDSFFDPEGDTGLYAHEEQAGDPRLYLQASSVMKDIRISILGEDGKPVTGRSFFVDVDQLGEYKDLDQDGLIYIPDLKAGEYFVTLEPVKGYETPADPMRVSVKEQLEYTVMDDIQLYIVTEDQVDEKVEDTEFKEASLDADETEVNTPIYEYNGRDAALGIDVSKYQKEIDWKRVAADGIQFAIIRCGYRGSSGGKLVMDGAYERNIKEAIDAGISVGVYFFSQAITEVEAVEEASMAVSLVKDYDLEYPIFIDVENAGGRADGLDKDSRTRIVKAFCETVESAGYRAGIYSARSWFNYKMDDAQLEPYVRWLAEWRANPLYTGKFNIWQYTSGGSVDGISTRVDLDLIWDGNF